MKGIPRFKKAEPKICCNCGEIFTNHNTKFCSRKCQQKFIGYRKKATKRESELAIANAIARESEYGSYGKYYAALRARFRPEDPKKHFGF